MGLLKVEDIHTYYGRSYILQGVTLEVRPHEIIGLLGRNGAGKTTTLKTILGLVKPRRGKIYFKNVSIASLPAFKIARMGMGYVPQGRGLFPKMTVLENLKTGMRKGYDSEGLNEMLALFPFLRERLHQQAGTLSGGEQQAVAIARALLTRPDLLLLDEPTTGLMPLFVEKLKGTIRQIRERGVAVLLVEEKVPFTLALADRLYFMVKGKIVHHGTRAALDKSPEVFEKTLGISL